MISLNRILLFLTILYMPVEIFAQRQIQPDEDLLDSSYEFQLGTYYILQYRANVRTEPNRESPVIAILSINDKIEILENSWFEETIDSVLSYWYKIKFGNIVGYTFGGNISVETLVTDLDNNGINDYFHYRFSGTRNSRFGMHYLDTSIDIIIYINNIKINTTDLKTEYDRMNRNRFEECEFISVKEDTGIRYVLIRLRYLGRDESGYVHCFKVTSDGKIEKYEY